MTDPISTAERESVLFALRDLGWDDDSGLPYGVRDIMLRAAALLAAASPPIGHGETMTKVTLTHTRSCPSLTPGEGPCTCALEERKALATEQTMHAAWRKRAEEAEAALAPTSPPTVGFGETETERLQIGTGTVRKTSPYEFAPGVVTWRQIETAPKDGREVIVGGANVMGAWREVAYWCNTKGHEGWYKANTCRAEHHTLPDATHWWPMPDAPAIGKGNVARTGPYEDEELGGVTEEQAEKKAWEIVRRVIPLGHVDGVYIRAAQTIKAAMIRSAPAGGVTEEQKMCPECKTPARQIWMQEHAQGCPIGRVKPFPIEDDGTGE